MPTEARTPEYEVVEYEGGEVEVPAHIELVPVEDVKPYVNNPKEHPDVQVGKIASSIDEFRWDQPMVLDANLNPGEIVKGHGRLLAAERLGLSHVPAVWVEYENEAEKRAARLADNRTNESGWDGELLASELDRIIADGYDVGLTGFDEDEVADHLDVLDSDGQPMGGGSPGGGFDVETGVHFEDAVDGMADRLHDDSVDVIVTDPPYGIDIDMTESYRQTRPDAYSRPTINEDDFESAMALLDRALVEFERVLRPDGHVYIFCRWDTYPEFYIRTGEVFDVRNRITWVKRNVNMMPSFSTGNVIRGYEHEDIIYATGDDPRALAGNPRDVVMHKSVPPHEMEHPTQKPVDLIEDLIGESTGEGDLVLDPFVGSGTTAVAAIQAGREFVGFENDPENWRETIERRVARAKGLAEAAERREGDDD